MADEDDNQVIGESNKREKSEPKVMDSAIERIEKAKRVTDNK